MTSKLRSDRGLAMVVVIMLMVILLSLVGGGLLWSGLDLKQASNVGTGRAAFNVADAGIQHALALIPAGGNFAYGSGITLVPSTSFPSASSGYTYVVTATNNPNTNPSTSTAILTSTANGPNGTKRVVQAYIGRSTSTWAPPGAVYIPGPASNPDFSIGGTATITGNDYNTNGSAGPAAAVPGIATNSATTTGQVASSISTPANVTGAGGMTPNVSTTNSPLDITALANSFLSHPYSTVCSGPTLGTPTTPLITYCKGIEIEGNTSGAGVLIVQGSLEIEDKFNFQGLIIVLGNAEIELSSINSTIYGGMFIAPNSPEISIKGGGAIKYSSQAITMVNNNWPGVLPQKAKVIAWVEPMQ